MLDLIEKIHSKFRAWAEGYIIKFLTKVDELAEDPDTIIDSKPLGYDKVPIIQFLYDAQRSQP